MFGSQHHEMWSLVVSDDDGGALGDALPCCCPYPVDREYDG